MIDAARRTRTHRPRAIVTGGAGFIGGHLADHLVAIGVEVLVIDDLSTGNEANIPADAAFERVDLLDADLVPMFRKWRGATVYHLAAQASVARSSRDPIRDLALNTTVTHRVAAAARAASARRLMFVSSGGAVYGETTRATTERTPPHPTSYYGVHKLAAEGHVRLAGLPYAIARPSNVYGPRQTAGLEGAVVAAFVANATADGALEIHGDGGQSRDFLHVADVVAALVLLAREETPPGVWNVATGRSVTVRELADLVERVAGRPLGRVQGPRRTGDVIRSALSARKLRRLGWRPSIGLADGVAALLKASATDDGRSGPSS